MTEAEEQRAIAQARVKIEQERDERVPADAYADDLSNPDNEPSFFTAAVYRVDRCYGGPEEGGWWWDRAVLVREADGIEIPLPEIVKTRDEARAACERMQAKLNAGINKGRRELSSVLSDGVYRACVCAGLPASAIPETAPIYE
jgi:hypothetical protein